MSAEAQKNGDSQRPEVEGYYEATRLMNLFRLERREVLDPLATYLRDITRTDILPPGLDRELGLELIDAKEQPAIIQSMGRMLPAFDLEEMQHSEREKFIHSLSEHLEKRTMRAASAPSI